MENNFSEHGPLFNVTHSSILKSLTIEFQGEIRDLIIANREAIQQKTMYMPYYGAFVDCMARQGFMYYEHPDNKLNRGYSVFQGTEHEIYFKFTNEELGQSRYICEIDAMDYDEKDYVNSVFKQKWAEIAQKLYNATLAYFTDADCAGKDLAAAPIAPVAAANPIPAAAAAEAGNNNRRQQLRKIAEEQRAKRLAALAKANKGLAAPPLEAEPIYNTNENVEMPAFGNLKLRALLGNNLHEVEHRFAVCYKNPDHAGIVEGDDAVVPLQHLNFIMRDPASSLAYQKILCDGVNPGYVGVSMSNSDIIIMLVEKTEHYEDDSFIAGILTLKVKPAVLEIDLICSNVGYKMAGIMLMNKAIRIARLLGLEKIELASVSTPETVRFYKRLGFKKVVGNNFAGAVMMKGLIPYRRRLTRKIRAPAAAGAGAAAPVLEAAQVKALFDKAVEKAGAAVVKPAEKIASNNALWAKQNALWAKAGKARKTRRLRKK